MTRLLQGIVLKGFGICPSWISKTHLHLANQTADQTAKPLDSKQNPNRLQADRHQAESAFDMTTKDYLDRTKRRTAKLLRVLAYDEKHRSTFILSADILVAADTASVIQKRLVDMMGVFSLIDLLAIKEENLIVHICSRPKVRKKRMNLKILALPVSSRAARSASLHCVPARYALKDFL